MANDSGNKFKWIIIGSLIGSFIGVIIPPLIKHLFRKAGVELGAPKTKYLGRR